MKRFILSVGLILSMCACQVLEDSLAADGDADSNDTTREDCDVACSVLTVCSANTTPEEFEDFYQIPDMSPFCSEECTDGKIFDNTNLYNISNCAQQVYAPTEDIDCDQHSGCIQFQRELDKM
jgi:hypothetical protein